MSNLPKESDSIQALEISRRQMLEKTLAGALQLAFMANIPSAFGHLRDEGDIVRGQKIDEARLQKDAQLFRDHNTITEYLQTALVSSAIALGDYIAVSHLSPVMKERGLALGGKSYTTALSLFDEIRKEPEELNGLGKTIVTFQKPLMVLSAVAGMPVLEEAIFRKTVADLFASDLPSVGVGWNIGIPSSMLFAIYHNVSIEGKVDDPMNPLDIAKHLNFDTKTIPLPQFILGMMCWYLMREKGLLHATEAHAVWNGTNAVAGLGRRLAKTVSERYESRGRYTKKQS